MGKYNAAVVRSLQGKMKDEKKRMKEKRQKVGRMMSVKEKQASCSESLTQKLGEEVCKCWKIWRNVQSSCGGVKRRGRSWRGIGDDTIRCNPWRE